MIFKPESLAFLSIFNSVAKGVSPSQQVTTIRTTEDKKFLLFYIFTDRMILLQKVENPTGEDFSGIFETSVIHSIIQGFDPTENTEITWEEGRISWEDSSGNSSSTELTQPQVKVADILPYLNLLEEKPKKKFSMVDLNLFTIARNFVGDKYLASVRIASGCIQAMNGNIGVILPCSLKPATLKFHVPITLLNILPQISLKSLEVEHFEELGDINDLTIYRAGNLSIFIPDETYQTPDMTKPEYSIHYEHPYAFGIDKLALEKALQKMGEILKNDPNRIISLTISVNGEASVLNITSEESESKMKLSVKITPDSSVELDKVSFKVNADIFKSFLKMITVQAIRVYLTSHPEDMTLLKVKSSADSQIFLFKLLD